MSATYSSFDTLTVQQFDEPSGLAGGQLPVLAEIPAIRVAQPKQRKAKPQATPSVQAPPAPHFKTEQADGFSASPAPTHSPADAAIVGKPVSQESDSVDWEEQHWAARFLEVESAVRPHAKLILLVALIALTGMTLMLLRSPVEIAPQGLPSSVVDAPRATPSVVKEGFDTQVAVAEEAPSVPGIASPLEPIPALPTAAAPTAKITAVGPSSLPRQDAWPTPVADITPIKSDSLAGTQPPAGAARAQGPAGPLPAVERVAERVSYPSTEAAHQAWTPLPTAGLPAVPTADNPRAAPPKATLLAPSQTPTTKAGHELH